MTATTVPAANPFPGMGTWKPGHRFILSVWPQQKMAYRIWIGRVAFTLPAAPRQGFVALKVYDQLTATTKYTMDGPERGVAPMTAEQICFSLAEQWAGNRVGLKNGKPGIGTLEPVAGMEYPEEIDSRLPISEQPPIVQELLARLLDLQTGYMEGLHREGLALHDEHKPVRTDCHMATQWLGLEYPFARIQKQISKKECLVCAADIPEKLLKCSSCGTDFPRYYLEHGVDPAGDSFVAAFIAKMSPEKRRQMAGEPEPAKPAAIPATSAPPEIKKQDVNPAFTRK